MTSTEIASQSNNLCDLPAVIGPCKSFVGRYFYNADSGDCEPFGYGGCEGNENRFVSLLACSE